MTTRAPRGRRRRLLAVQLSGALVCALGLPALEAAPAASATYQYSRAGAIRLPDADGGAADPYPSTIQVYGAGTAVVDVEVTLAGVFHDHPDDLDIELVAPDGTAVPLMSDACGAEPLARVDLTFDDAAPQALPDGSGCGSGTYRPTDRQAAAPDLWEVTPTAQALSGLAGINPNGAWRLYVRDDEGDPAVDQRIADGWRLDLTTAAAPAIAIPGPDGRDGSGAASPYPYTVPVAGLAGPAVDVDIRLPGLTHATPGSLQILLVAPGGKSVVLMAGACGQTPLRGVDLVFDDGADQKLGTALGTCASGTRKPTSGDDVVPFPAPAPPGPYGTTMGALRGSPASGAWQVYVLDLRQDNGGYLAGSPTVQLRVDTKAPGTKLTKRPRKVTSRQRAKISFTATEAGASFECKVDKRRWRSCTSPLRLKRVAVGRHRVLVRAVDAAGNTDPTPATVTWRVSRRR